MGAMGGPFLMWGIGVDYDKQNLSENLKESSCPG